MAFSDRLKIERAEKLSSLNLPIQREICSINFPHHRVFHITKNLSGLELQSH
jgi:hypothetical protein